MTRDILVRVIQILCFIRRFGSEINLEHACYWFPSLLVCQKRKSKMCPLALSVITRYKISVDDTCFFVSQWHCSFWAVVVREYVNCRTCGAMTPDAYINKGYWIIKFVYSVTLKHDRTVHLWSSLRLSFLFSFFSVLLLDHIIMYIKTLSPACNFHDLAMY